MTLYRLGDAAAKGRARATAVIASATELAPLALVIVLLHRLGYARGVPLYGVIGGVAALTVARLLFVYRRLARKLRSFEVGIDGETLRVETDAAKLVAPRAEVRRVIEVPGALGGLRVELLSGVPERVDIPRGGEGFGELRAALEAWGPVERPPRRRRAMWIALALLFVGAVFFVPFFLDDVVARSRVAVLALVLGTWFALRIYISRRK